MSSYYLDELEMFIRDLNDDGLWDLFSGYEYWVLDNGLLELEGEYLRYTYDLPRYKSRHDGSFMVYVAEQ